VVVAASAAVAAAFYAYIKGARRRRTVLAVATLDSKGEELAFVSERIRRLGCACVIVDVSCKDAPMAAPDVTREEVAAYHPDGAAKVLSASDRGEAVTAMAAALSQFVTKCPFAFDAMIGIGGSGGTALITPAMQALPVGFPKLMVTTMASGDVSGYVGCSDVTVMPSVVDVAGINAISTSVLSNAAAAAAGMALQPKKAVAAGAKPMLAMSMFGVTTPCCDAVRKALEAQYEVLTFHATGAGGKAMEKLATSGVLAGVLDLTTTEVADEVVGGVLTAGPERLDMLAATALPAVVSVGALDMVNFGAAESVPAQFKARKLHVHNAQVTLMRTTAEELRKIAGFLAAKLNKSTGPLTLLLPGGGLSLIDAPGMPFHDADAMEALFDELTKLVVQTPSRVVRRVAANINDATFAEAAASAFVEMMAMAKAP